MATRSTTPRKPRSVPIGNCSATTLRPKDCCRDSMERSKLESSRSIQVRTTARGHTRGEEQRRHQLRLSGAAVADNANVANVLGEIRLHTDLPVCAARGVQARSVL